MFQGALTLCGVQRAVAMAMAMAMAWRFVAQGLLARIKKNSSRQNICRCICIGGYNWCVRGHRMGGGSALVLCVRCGKGASLYGWKFMSGISIEI